LLAEQWQSGSGAAAAGEKLVELYEDSGDQQKRNATFAALLARADAPPDVFEELWNQFRNQPEASHLSNLLPQIVALRFRRNPENENLAFDCAKELDSVGRRDEALRGLENIAMRSIFVDRIAGEVAPLFAQLGDRGHATEMFADAVADDPAANDFQLYLDYARLLREESELRSAMKYLRLAFRNPLNHEVGQIVDFYAATNRLDRLENEAASFSLSAENLQSLHAELFLRCSASAASGDAASRALAKRVLENHPEIANREDVRARLHDAAANSANSTK